MSRRRSVQIFLTSPMPVWSSSGFGWWRRCFRPRRIDSALFSRAHITNGKPNLFLYLKIKNRNKEQVRNF